MNVLKLRSGNLVADISLAGGSVMRFGRIDLSGAYTPVFYRGSTQSPKPLCFPLVPFGNRLRGNSFSFDDAEYVFKPNAADPLYIHGDGWLADWRLTELSTQTASVDYFHRGTGPYHYLARQSFVLSPCALTITISATNCGGVSLPFGLGLHPFFPLASDTILEFASRLYWLQDDTFLPVDSEPAVGVMDFSRGRKVGGAWLNNEFEGWDGHAVISTPSIGYRLVIDADPIFSRCMLYVPTREYDPDYQDDWFCFEPMTHGVDGHHRPDLSGLKILEPGETVSGSCTFKAGLS